MPQNREKNKIKTQRASTGRDIAKIDATLSVLRIVMLYAFFAGLWILFSDQLLGLLIRDAGTITLISTLKGWFFVLVTSTLLYVLVRRLAGQLMRAAEKEQIQRLEHQQTLETLQAIIDNSTDAIFVKDLDGRYQVANTGLSRLLQKPVSEILQATDFDLFPEGIAQQFHEDDRRIMASEKTETYEEDVATPTDTLPYLTTKGPLIINGKIRGVFGIARDISSLKQSEERLQHSLNEAKLREDELEAIFEALPDLFFLMSLDGTVLEYRAQKTSDLYQPPEVFLGKRMQDLLPPELGNRITQQLELIRKGRRQLSIEYDLPLPHGLKHFEARFIRLEEEDEVICLARDITTQHTAQKALVESQERLLEAEHIAQMGNWELDINTGIADWSEEVLDITGVDPEQELGPAFLSTIVNPEDWQMVEASLNAAITEGTPHEVEYRIKRPADGGERWLYCKAERKLDSEGKPEKLTGIAQDITLKKQSQAALQQSEESLRSVVGNMPVMLDAVDEQGNILVWNSEAERVTGYSAEEMLHNPKAWEMLYPDREYREKMATEWQQRGDHRNWLWKIRAKDGRDLYIEWSNISNQFPIPGWASWGIGIDVTHRIQSEERQRLAASVFDNTDGGVVITDANSKVIEVNRAFTDILGYTRDEVIGKNPRMWSSGRHDRNFYRNLWESLSETGHWRGEIWNRRKDGSIFPEWLNISSVRDEHNRLTHYVAVFTDISQIKHSQEQLDHLAHHDALTDLPNRLLLNERLEQAIKHAGRHSTQFAIIFLDLDNFKHINDSLGHTFGDQLLYDVANQLIDTVRQDDTVARIGGDEFVLIMEDIERPISAATAAEKVMSIFSQPFHLQEHEVRVTASLGISLYPRDGETASELLSNADAAMYRAKQEGRDNYQFYTRELTRNAFERVLLENSLRQAIDQQELYLLYQPQYDLRSGEVTGLEALVRWKHPELGTISPARFIPIAEECGLIHPIGQWVLETACRQGSEWLRQELEFGRIAVNISGQQIQRGNLLYDVSKALSGSELPANRLELEVTEGFIMDHATYTVEQLNHLRELGITLAIDDFGTGYSSLSYLKKLPFHKVKLDQSFVRDIPEDPNDMAISDAVIAMSRSLGLTVIAEGVETREQESFLRDAGCQEVQGFLFSRPLEAESITQLLSAK